ncbi:MAG: hypothetical protein Q9174_006591 [Haloplaca sp. 1 TL-2023]
MEADTEAENRISRMKRSVKDNARHKLELLRKARDHNLQTFRRQPLQEISGAFGDLGTLLPILIAYTDVNRYSGPAIDLSTTLVFTGIFNVVTGVVFGIPLPVQPMKAIAAVALSSSFSENEVASAGLLVAGVVGFLSITGLLEWFNRRIPVPVIKGIQVGVGLSLIIYGGTIFGRRDDFDYNNPGLVNLLQVLAFLGLLASNNYHKLPLALILLFIGFLFALPGLIRHPALFGIWQPHALLPQPWEFQRGIDAGLGQVPLTVLNSIIAVTALSADLLPELPPPSPTALGLSVTAMNLLGCWFGSVPVCHGSGGLAAQYRFGARSGASIILLGLIKFILGLFAGPFTARVFRSIPNAILGIMVIAAGLELANVGETLNSMEARDHPKAENGDANTAQDQRSSSPHAGTKVIPDWRRRRWTTMLITIGGILTFKNTVAGFIAGMLCHWSYQLHDRHASWRSQREGTIRLGEEETRGRETDNA